MKGMILVLVGCLLFAAAACSGPVVYLDQFGETTAVDNPAIVDAVSALNALGGGPPRTMAALGLTSAVPRGSKVLDFAIEGDTAIVNFNNRLTAGGIDEARIEAIYEQVRWTLWNYGVEISVRILVDGTPLADFLPVPSPVLPKGSAKVSPNLVSVSSLSGRSITLDPGHGLFWTGSSWATARPVYCSPLSQEDYHNLELCIYLQTYLANDGMVVKTTRCTNLSQGASPYNGGQPWWKMGASYWLKQVGYPCTIYAPSTGDCNLGTGSSEDSDNISSRPRAADYDNTNIVVSMHTNGYQGDCTGAGCPTGTCTYYDCGTEHASYCTVSRNLSNAVQASLISTIRNDIPISNWTDRGSLDSNGSFAITRVPDRAAILIELGFHDTCDRDAVYLRDNFFRSATMWAVYKGICDYFGTTPTYGFYSSENVSNTIPSTMVAGETRSVSVTMRNKGVLWNAAKEFKLGAVGDSDPFTTVTRQTISGEVGPNGTYTFTFNLTAPSTPGTYTTDWRMLREMVTWFGATCSKTITVSASAPTEIIIDNSDGGFTASSSWITATSSTDKYGTNYRYRSTAATSDMAVWTPNITSSGTYTVSAWWAQGTNRASNATYHITHSAGTTQVNVNQQVNGGRWNSLGSFSFGTGTGYPTKLSCWTTTGFVVIADAIKWNK